MTRLASAMVVVVMPLAAQAGAWTSETGSAYQKLAVNSFSSNSTFGNAAVGVRKFTDIKLIYYAEYDLRDNFAFFASVPFKAPGWTSQPAPAGQRQCTLVPRQDGAPIMCQRAWRSLPSRMERSMCAQLPARPSSDMPLAGRSMAGTSG